MKVLILSCNTGEGHNSAGKAVKEYIESHGDQAEFIDLMMLSGKKTSKAVGGPSLGVSTIIFWSLFRLEIATVSINAGFFCFLKT